MNIPCGDLYRWRDRIKEFLHEGYIQYVVINSWEFSSKNSRYREEATFLMKELTDGLEGGHNPVHALIYAQEISSMPQVQKIQRSGFGKLSGIAKKVVSISIDDQSGSDETMDGTHDLPEVHAISEVQDPCIGTEDEPGIDGDEAQRRFLARVKQTAAKEWKEKNKPYNTVLEVATEQDEIRKRKESEKTDHESVVDLEKTNNQEPPAIILPLTSIEELRNTPQTISKMPIHLNSFSPIKNRMIRPNNRGKIHGSMKK